MPMSKLKTISDLPVQLLARILGVLDTKERLQSPALVSSTWHSAAILATRAVSAMCAAAVPSLSAWLVAHSSTAGVTRIVACSMSTVPQELQLPLQQLCGLEELRLMGIRVVPTEQQEPSTTALQPDGPLAPVLSALTALTLLRLYECQLQLHDLGGLTSLQSLGVGPPDQIDPNKLVFELSKALPALQRLTWLSLIGDATQDRVMQQFSGLTSLQHLALRCCKGSASSLQELPQSLTHLELQWPSSGGLNAVPSPPISPDSTPGLCKLTALQSLDVQHVTSFDLEVLRGLTGLEHLVLANVRFVGATLSVLTALTKLQHLTLPSLEPEVLPSSADVGAATASTQLTFLDISDSFDHSSQHTALFGGSKQLPKLVELRSNLGMMDHRAAKVAASCCPNLQKLRLSSTQEAPFDGMALDEESWGLATMLKRWRPVKSLTSLELFAGFHPMEVTVWEALGSLTQLCKLELLFNDLAYLPGMLHLRDCRQLTHLDVSASDPESYAEFNIEASAKAAADGTTTIHDQLPQLLQDALLPARDGFGQQPKLVEALIKMSVNVQRQQQVQIKELQRQQQDCNQQLQAQVTQLQQQVVQLQASLAAVVKQLQG